jgi:hypothetical protein
LKVIEENIKEVKDMAKELAPQADRLPSEVYEIMDDADTELIVSSLAGKVIEKYVYYLPDIKAYGLSVNGVEDACRYMAEHGEFIRIEDMPQVIIDEKGCLANVIARRYVKDGKTGTLICADTALGTKYELRIKKKRNGSTWEDKNFREIAISKAARNGKSKLILEEIKVKLIEKYKKMTGKTGELKRPTPPESNRIRDPNIIKIQQLKRELIELGVWQGDSDYRNFLENNFVGDQGEAIFSSKNLSDMQKVEAIDMMAKMKNEVEEEGKVEEEKPKKATDEQLLIIRQLKETLGERYFEKAFSVLSPEGADKIIHGLEERLKRKEGQ